MVRTKIRGAVLGMSLLTATMVNACGGNDLPPPAAAPTQVAACLTFVLEDAPEGQVDVYAQKTVTAVREAVVAELVAAGFAIVTDRSAPHDVVLKLTTVPGSRIETNAKVRSKFSLEGASGPIDTVEAEAPQESAELASSIATSLVDGLFRSGNLGGYIKQLRRGTTGGLARASLRGADKPTAAACAGFIATASPTAAPAPTVSAAAIVSATPAAPPLPELLAGSAQKDTFAVVLGVEKYKLIGAGAPAARADAEQIAKLFTRTFGVAEAHLKTGYDTRADRLAFDLVFEWLKLNVPKGGRVLFYFAGLGVGAKPLGTPAILPHDGDPKQADKTAITIDALLKHLGETSASEILVVIDAAYAGSGGRTALSADRPLLSMKPASVPARTMLLSAVTGAEGCFSMPDGGSAFTHHLVEGAGKGLADTNADGAITVQEWMEWAGSRVSRHAKRAGGAQKPSTAVGPGAPGAAKVTIASGLDTP